MKLIRNSVFETNSSSAHSLSYGTSKVVRGGGWGLPPDESDFSNPLYYLKEIPMKYKDYTLYEELGEYGWYGDDLTTPQEKFSYLLTGLGECIPFVREHPFYTQIEEWLDKLDVRFHKAWHYTYGDDGYIDHQSEYIVNPSLFKTKEDLITYLFNDDLIIHIENDNEECQAWYTGEQHNDL